MPNAAIALSGLTQPMSRVRYAAGAYVGGRWVESTAPTTDTIEACPQPVKPEELMMLPEGDRTKGSYVFYSTSELRTANEALRISQDQVIYDGNTYEILMAWKWKVGFLDHYKAIGVRKEK